MCLQWLLSFIKTRPTQWVWGFKRFHCPSVCLSMHLFVWVCLFVCLFIKIIFKVQKRIKAEHMKHKKKSSKPQLHRQDNYKTRLVAGDRIRLSNSIAWGKYIFVYDSTMDCPICTEFYIGTRYLTIMMVKNHKFQKFNMAGGFSPNRYGCRCYNPLLRTRCYCLDHRGDRLVSVYCGCFESDC